ncbi:hypothetical protein L208DRAFT_257152 [Tricholoma matsutake]|nr:hypothetical protein L208DRAFT_257152 [Tricholoma matsutake 945]
MWHLFFQVGGHPSSNLQPNPNLRYIYTAPGTTPSVASQMLHILRPSFCALDTTSKPLLQSKSGRMQLYRTISDKLGITISAPYAIYSCSNSYTSVQSASSLSISSSTSEHQHPPMAPRTSCATSVDQYNLSWGITAHPCLRASSATSITKTCQDEGWIGHSSHGPQAHLSQMRNNLRPQIHCLPISYDIAYMPFSRTVVDQSTFTPIPNHTCTTSN